MNLAARPLHTCDNTVWIAVAHPNRKAALVTGSFALLGTFPPTQCGIATFTNSLARHMADADAGARVGVVRVIDGPAAPAVGVVGSLRTDVSGTERAAAQAFNDFDVAIVQHEYGIYAGSDHARTGRDGRTGYLVATVDQAVAALPGALALDRSVVAATARRRFSADRMIDGYMSVYRQFLDRR